MKLPQDPAQKRPLILGVSNVRILLPGNPVGSTCMLKYNKVKIDQLFQNPLPSQMLTVFTVT